VASLIIIAQAECHLTGRLSEYRNAG